MVSEQTATIGPAARHALVQARNRGFGDARAGHLIAARARVNGRPVAAGPT